MYTRCSSTTPSCHSETLDHESPPANLMAGGDSDGFDSRRSPPLQQSSVALPRPKTKEPDDFSDNRIYVSNIPFSFRDRDLASMFSTYGTVIDVQVVCNERGSKGFGFVTLDTKEACIRARAELHGRQVQGRVIEVRKATPMVAKKIGPRTVKTDSRFFPTSPSTAVPLQNTQTMSILQQQQIIANLLLAQNPLVVQTLLNQPAVGLSLLGMVPRLAPPPLMGNVISPLGSFGVGAMPLNNYGVASSLPQGFRCQPAVNVLNLPGSIDLLASIGVGVGLMPPQSTFGVQSHSSVKCEQLSSSMDSTLHGEPLKEGHFGPIGSATPQSGSSLPSRNSSASISRGLSGASTPTSYQYFDLADRNARKRHFGGEDYAVDTKQFRV